MKLSKKGKKYKEAVTLVDREKYYSPTEAIQIIKSMPKAKFDETVEVAVRLGVDPRRADQQVRGTVVLPHGTGRTVKVAAFAKGEKAKEAEAAGADIVGAEDLAEKIQGGWLDFDVTVATPDMMSIVGKLGRVLGPRGLMPNPKAGTVTMDITNAIRDIKAGKVEYRVDRTSIVHVPIGKISFEEEKLLENLKALLEAIIRARPVAYRGQYMKSISISSTMSPGVKISPQSVILFISK